MGLQFDLPARMMLYGRALISAMGLCYDMLAFLQELIQSNVLPTKERLKAEAIILRAEKEAQEINQLLDRINERGA